MRRSILAVCVLALGACAVPPKKLTRAQWLDMTSRRITGTTVEQVLTKAGELLELADPTDVEVQHAPGRMVATRRYTYYAVLAAGFGTYSFDLSATQDGPDVVAQLAIGASSQPVTVAPTAGGDISAGAGFVSGKAVTWRESYDLFFDRLESLLGKKEWVRCSEARENIPSQAVDALCFLADDKIPTGVPLSAKTRKYAAAVEERRREERRVMIPCTSDSDCVNGGICYERVCRK